MREGDFLAKRLVECEEGGLIQRVPHLAEDVRDEPRALRQIRGETHASAGIEQERDADGCRVCCAEVDDGPGLALLEDLKVLAIQIPHEPIVRVAHDRRDWDERHAGPEGSRRRILRLSGSR
jgi:hypothetical protein